MERSGDGLTPGEWVQGAYRIESWVGGTQHRCRILGKGKISYLCRESNHSSSAVQSIAKSQHRLPSDYFEIKKKNQQLLKKRRNAKTKERHKMYSNSNPQTCPLRIIHWLYQRIAEPPGLSLGHLWQTMKNVGRKNPRPLVVDCSIVWSFVIPVLSFKHYLLLPLSAVCT